MGHASKPNFSHSAQQAQQWVNELAADLGWPENLSHRLMRAVLQALRDWLSPEEAADLSSQLPEMIRGIYFEGWDPAKSPAVERDKRDFVLRISKSLNEQPEVDIEEGIAAVFRLLDRHLSHGEIVQVKNSMRKSLRHLWPE
ncbi:MULTISPECIES: DUF2267 domain-containing protein [Aminobacter]|jgi:uncharacterized protein (DUF2267 family)|uniref:Uncharacterized protein (DUF2267 family) n=2 Tax=Aminobacter TaxID=31988 RepID=A0AAC8YR80_AMIAI|nr:MULTISPECIES: DUF2267 domain-containing protein [Aminobacter]AMS42126.1 hypothetical protein AA2016_3203 [Aminobacter aminovorans]MBA8906185.1 uncharacterized protein (DUF2267 family) [Aminobacter ciceronei]MBA9019964.1 uncharacterized protein (DUF2267 family) [Aminobacter ciceronei]MBB3706634.1 uncharacterized protein (DUF2267 family) [Aminobacter aminovorans]QNH32191.1 DUF2267 domain-containing protein [Aminobacter sp. MDW-2]